MLIELVNFICDLSEAHLYACVTVICHMKTLCKCCLVKVVNMSAMSYSEMLPLVQLKLSSYVVIITVSKVYLS